MSDRSVMGGPSGFESPFQSGAVIRWTPEMVADVLYHREAELGQQVRDEIITAGVAEAFVKGEHEVIRTIDYKPFKRLVEFDDDQAMLNRLTYLTTLGVQAAVQHETGNVIFDLDVANGIADEEEGIAWVSISRQPSSD